jgi:hypothetical protein
VHSVITTGSGSIVTTGAGGSSAGGGSVGSPDVVSDPLGGDS